MAPVSTVAKIDIELYRDTEEEPDYPVGYLSEVPFLEQVPLPVQVDLLAETWARHRNPMVRRAGPEIASLRPFTSGL
jgi:hypothetical protein